MITSRRNFIVTMLGAATIAPAAMLPTPANLCEHLKSCWIRFETKEILQSLPMRKAGIVSRQEAPLTILSDSRLDLMQLNPIAARIWDLCDSRNSYDAMIQKVVGDYDISSSICAQDVLFTLRTFKRKGLILC